MIKAILWDIDGTLVDSEPLHLKALLAVCAKHDVNISDLADDHFIGVNLYGVWEALRDRFSKALTMATWVDELNAEYANGVITLEPILGAYDVVVALNAQGIRQAAVSNSNRVVVDSNLTALGVTEQMEFSLSLDDVKRGKPAPDPYLQALDKLGLSAADAIAIEDSQTGVKSAKSAGIKALGLGATHLNADEHIDALSEILNFIEVT